VSSLRVISLGAREAERSLRRDPEVELVRADDPLDVVAELARPMESASDDGAPGDIAVIVEKTRLPEREAAAFIAAARSASPGVTLLTTEAGSHGFDGVWTDDGPIESTAPDEHGAADDDGGVIENEHAGEEHAEEPVAPAPTAVEAAPPSPAPPRVGVDAGAEAAALPAGAEAAHLELFIRGQSSREDLESMASARLGRRASIGDEASAGAVAIERRGRLYGWLSAPGASPAALTREASHIAGWMALGEQVGQLRTAAFVDDLTGAWNRGFFRRHLPKALDAARASRRDITLMLYDIDDFKHYNDAYGHGAGDEILRETVKLLQSVIRPSDRVCRIGGDEFAVIFDDPSGARRAGGGHPRSIRAIAQRFQRQICEHRFPALGDEARSTLTISGGMATFPWDGADADSLIKAADDLLLASKRGGKNAITLGPGARVACPPAPETDDDGDEQRL